MLPKDDIQQHSFVEQSRELHNLCFMCEFYESYNFQFKNRTTRKGFITVLEALSSSLLNDFMIQLIFSVKLKPLFGICWVTLKICEGSLVLHMLHATPLKSKGIISAPQGDKLTVSPSNCKTMERKSNSP